MAKSGTTCIWIVKNLYLTSTNLFRGSSYMAKRSVDASTYCRYLHCSTPLGGLEEFFPKGDDIIEEAEKTGRPWQARELRQKSTEDLHKLWYVLLKERNMLLTLKHEAKRVGFRMPAPERMWKVRKSMARIKVVISERDQAVNHAKIAADLHSTITPVNSSVSDAAAYSNDSPTTQLEAQNAVQR